MKGEERILKAFERNAKALSLRPTLGQGTATTRVRLKEGYLCEAEDGNWSLQVDMSEKSGGSGSAPDPGVYGRTALGSCLVLTYAAWAAKLDIEVSSIEVEVQADYDSNGFHGLGEAPAGYRQVRYVVTVESDASDKEIQRFLDTSDEHCAYLDVFSRAMDVHREVEIVKPARRD